MNISNIQSQLAVNRAILNMLHKDVESDKGSRKLFSSKERLDLASFYHKEVIRTKKQIAKLVVLQKALKKDLSREIAYERAARALDSIVRYEA